MIPSGTVTFLFTDIEGSTRLAQVYPDKIHDALAKHHSILEKVINENNGYIFEIVGDAFCTAFADPCDALNAAKEIQLNLLKEKIQLAGKAGDGADIKVRIGIHSGDVEVSNGKYIGYTVMARTHRVMSAANGGQVLFTQAVHSFLKDTDVNSISFRNLGERRLKDLIRSEHIYQVISDDLPSDFPPIKTLDARLNNLPVQLTSFIGREKQMIEIKNLLSKTRLLTLLGSGGTGKTRLSIQIGADIIDEFADGVWITELASLKDPQYIYQEIASSLNLNAGSSTEPKEAVIDYLRQKELLLILDNCEHMIYECTLVTENILKNCRRVKILATSREEMNTDGETTYRIPSLSLPDKNQKINAELLSQFEAVRLFIDRALLIKNDFKVTNENIPALAELCFRLDGIPLAIELAAARVNVLTVDKILEKLDNMFNLLTGGKRTSLPRQKTLRALIDWSYDLLSEKEKLLWQRLAVFTGGWNYEAAKEICSYEGIEEDEILDLISNLIRKSIIILVEEEFDIRYTMLETIRHYGIEKQTDSMKIHLRHVDYFCKYAEVWTNSINEEWEKNKIELFEFEHDNFRSAINWCIENNPEKATELVLLFGRFIELRAYFLEGLMTYTKVLNANLNVNKKIKGSLLIGAGHCATMIGENKQAENLLKEGLNLFKESEDKVEQANYYNSLGLLQYYSGKFEEAEKYYEKSLALCKESNFKVGIANALSNLAAVIQSKGDCDLAMKQYETALAIYKEFKQVPSIPRVLANMATLEHYSGNYEKAITLYEECIKKFREFGDNDGLAATYLNLGNANFILKDFLNAEKYYKESNAIARHYGYRNLISNSEIRLGDIALAKDEVSVAIKIYTDSITSLNKTDELHSIGNCFKGLGFAYYKTGDNETSVKMLAIFNSIFEKIGLQLSKAKKEEFEEVIQSLKSSLGEKAFGNLWDEGSLLDIDKAVEIIFSNRKQV